MEQKSTEGAKEIRHQWTDMRHFMGGLPNARDLMRSDNMPKERWGHTSVAVYDKKFFIIGGY